MGEIFDKDVNDCVKTAAPPDNKLVELPVVSRATNTPPLTVSLKLKTKPRAPPTSLPSSPRLHVHGNKRAAGEPAVTDSRGIAEGGRGGAGWSGEEEGRRMEI